MPLHYCPIDRLDETKRRLARDGEHILWVNPVPGKDQWEIRTEIPFTHRVEQPDTHGNADREVHG